MSLSVIEAIQISRTVKRIKTQKKILKSQKKAFKVQKLQKTHKVGQKVHQGVTDKVKLAAYAKINQKFKNRNDNLSIFKNINKQMIKMWTMLKDDGTKQSIIEEEEEELQELYNVELLIAESSKDKALQKSILKEMNAFNSMFQTANVVDQQTEEHLLELEKQEREEAEFDKNQKLSKDELDSKKEIFLRNKYAINLEIMEGQQELIRIFTDFLNPTKDEATFNKRLIKALENSLPDKFCYRKAAELAESQVKVCPSTHPEKKLGLCVETCSQGQRRKNLMMTQDFKPFLGVCWETCKPSRSSCKTKALIVYPNGYSWTNWHFKRSFIPSFKTAFNKDVKCPRDAEKWGFLCYQKVQHCEEIGYKKCGIAACALDKWECGKTITDMVLSTFLGIGKFALMFVAPGLVNGIQLAISIGTYSKMMIDLIAKMLASKNLFVYAYNNEILRAKMIKKAMAYMQKNGYDNIDGNKLSSIELGSRVSNELDNQIGIIDAEEKDGDLKEALKDPAKHFAIKGGQVLLDKHVLKSAAKGVAKILTTAGVAQTIAQNGGAEVLGKTVVSKVFNIALIVDVYMAFKTCGNSQSSDLACTKAVMGPIAILDPTGLVGIAKAFMYTICEDN